MSQPVTLQSLSERRGFVRLDARTRLRLKIRAEDRAVVGIRQEASGKEVNKVERGAI